MDGLERVTRDDPCKVCGKPDWCYRLARYHCCYRIKSDRPTEKGGWMHLRSEEFVNNPIPPRPRRVSDAELRAKWEPIALAAAKAGIGEIPRLAKELGVDTDALLRLNIGYADIEGSWAWTFPERNTKGWIVGITRRLVCPVGKNKLCCKGSRRGLTYCDGWDAATGPILLPEGGSDTAACITLGLAAIGRPSNMGGIEMLTQLLKPHKSRRIIVLGERDKKSPLYVHQHSPDHNPRCPGCLVCYPGKAGAVQTAKALSAKLKRQVQVKMPPRGFKDIREWVQSLTTEDRVRHAQSLQKGRFAPAGP